MPSRGRRTGRQGGGVDLVGEGAEADAVFVELLGEVDEILHGAAEPVEFPDDESIADAELFERFRQPWLISAGATDGVRG